MLWYDSFFICYVRKTSARAKRSRTSFGFAYKHNCYEKCKSELSWIQRDTEEDVMYYYVIWFVLDGLIMYEVVLLRNFHERGIFCSFMHVELNSIV